MNATAEFDRLESELLKLVDACLTDHAADEELARLDALVSQDRVARQIYLNCIHDSVVLESWADTVIASPGSDGSGPTEFLGPSTNSAGKGPIFGFLETAINVSASWLSSPKALAAMVVGCLSTYFLGLMISIAINRAFLVDRQVQEVAGGSVAAPARVIADSGCRWEVRSRAAARRGTLPAASTRLTAGIAELEFEHGAHVWIEGPAEFTPHSGQRVELARGRLMAYVPRQARGFIVDTPTAELVDLGTEFGVDVDAVGKTDLHVLQGTVEVRSVKSDSTSQRASQKIAAGQAVRISADSQTSKLIRLDESRFTSLRSATNRAAQASWTGATSNPFLKGETIRLGNLFDDRPHVPLIDAMHSDTFGAGADMNDLGVDRVIAGGKAVQEIAPDISFDFTTVGWESYGLPQVVNDAWRLDDNLDNSRGIRVTGAILNTAGRLEDGICQTGNTLITFHLDDLRAAGNLQGKSFEFISERVGINDHWVSETRASIHLAVLVSTATGVRQAFVDGERAALVEQNGCWSIASPIGKPLRNNGPIVSFHVPVAASDKYLTLVSTTAGDGPSGDQPVWIDARLEVRP